MIEVGAIVRLHRHGETAWVVAGKTFDGRWRVTSKVIDRSRREAFNGFTAGNGDMVIGKARTYL